ncbi:MAG: 4-(cytidine 5'-diphospho)-2-C-methyl-D-erythritol kinase [Elusimicrobiaceae bacterium]|nr:4-(cytidine 5'-diphospho)-2-C-methyl-D-erythritol kinase [Elusimicrobiaceae bacterium]
MKITRFCPAKINLFLEITGKRPNGYHELATLFAKINVGDHLTVCAEPSLQTHISLTLTGPIGKMLRADESNLVCRAARGFLEHYGLTARVDMILDKHVPTGAGLGGGSSDAAGTLLALCEIFNKNKQELMTLAAKLGADVPLFMFEDTFLKGEGIGEKLTPVTAAGPLPWLVLVYPNTVVPTSQIFNRAHLATAEKINMHVSQLNQLITALSHSQSLTEWKHLLFNRLEEYVVPFTPSVEKALADLSTFPGAAVRMSGSGSTVFALVDTKENAQKLADRVRHPQRRIFLTSFYTK